MIVRWTFEAQQDRSEIFDHISGENPKAALRMDELFEDAAKTLESFPNRGRIGKIPGTREILPHQNYRLIYEVHGEAVAILALIHAARRWPPMNGE